MCTARQTAWSASVPTIRGVENQRREASESEHSAFVLFLSNSESVCVPL